jgi:hypothetical protein
MAHDKPLLSASEESPHESKSFPQPAPVMDTQLGSEEGAAQSCGSGSGPRAFFSEVGLWKEPRFGRN